jgi:hypothetical protein
MELRNNEIYLTQKEQKALDVAVNPLPAHELEGAWWQALDQAEGQVRALRGQRETAVSWLAGMGGLVDGQPTRPTVDTWLKEAHNCIARLQGMGHAVMTIAMETMRESPDSL